MDRQTFLAKLLESKNTVPVGKGWQHCQICKEKFVDHSDGAEEPEKQLRLPCHKRHTMGSACITKWLEQHNSCPICRQELFPAEVAELDNDDVDGEEDDGYDESDGYTDYDEYDEDDSDYPRYREIRSLYDLPVGERQINEVFSAIFYRLGFTGVNHPTKSVALLIARRIWDEDIIQNDSSFSGSRRTCGNASFAAACVYAATWLSCQEISGGRRGFHKRTTIQIAEHNPCITKDCIRRVYRTIYDHRHKIVTADALERIAAKDIMTGINRFPVWRPRRTPRTVEPHSARRRQRDVSTPAQRRRRQRNDQTN